MRRLVTFPRRKYEALQEKTRERINKEANYYAQGGDNESVNARTEELIVKASFVIAPVAIVLMLLKWLF